MSTRSFIHVKRTDDKWARVYCHFDGYWDGVGQTLQRYYNSQEKAEALVALGDISFLGEEIGEKHDFNFRYKFYDKYRNNYKEQKKDPDYIRLCKMCNVYGRDRGDTDVDAQIGDTLDDVFADEEYMYVWRDGAWFGMSNTDDLSYLRPLSEILTENDILLTLNSTEDDAAEESAPAAETPVWAAP